LDVAKLFFFPVDDSYGLGFFLSSAVDFTPFPLYVQAFG